MGGGRWEVGEGEGEDEDEDEGEGEQQPGLVKSVS